MPGTTESYLEEPGALRRSHQSFENAIESNPNYAMAWNNKGNVLSALHRYNDAVDCFERATDIDPNYFDAWNNKGNALAQLLSYEDAIYSYEKQLR